MKRSSIICIGIGSAIGLAVITFLSVYEKPEDIPTTTDIPVTTDIPATTDIPTTTTIATSQGKVRGRNSKNYDTVSFYNIPYAQPPIGNFRWQPPQYEQPPSWEGVRDSTTIGNICVQNSHEMPQESEDCLFLNVATPDVNPDVLLPVFVYIHGGAYQSGAAIGMLEFYGWEHNPLIFASDQKVVVVSMNYRLGTLGFAGVESEFLGEKTMGNFGLMDQYAAMFWVRQNIHYFGGDASRITIGGESAGAESALAHILWDKSRNDNHIEGGILVSHTWGIPYYTTADGETDLKRLSHKVGCTKSRSQKANLDCMRQISAQNMTKTHTVTISSFVPFAKIFQPWAPIVDGVIVKDQPLPNIQSRTDLPPIMSGTSADEGEPFINMVHSRPWSHELYSSLEKLAFKQNASKVLDEYPYDGDDWGVPAATIATDVLFSCPERAPMSRGTNYVYRWLRPGIFEEWAGEACLSKACHAYPRQWYLPFGQTGIEVEFCGNESFDESMYETSEIDLEIGSKFRQHMGDFIRNGEPGVEWKPFGSDYSYMRVNDDGTFVMEDKLNNEKCNFWDEINNYGNF